MRKKNFYLSHLELWGKVVHVRMFAVFWEKNKRSSTENVLYGQPNSHKGFRKPREKKTKPSVITLSVIYRHLGTLGTLLPRLIRPLQPSSSKLFLQQLLEQPVGLSAQANSLLCPPARHPGESSSERCRKSVFGSDFPAQFNSYLIS